MARSDQKPDTRNMTGGLNTASPDTIRAMTPEMLFDYFAVWLNGPNAAGKKIALNVNFTDLKK